MYFKPNEVNKGICEETHGVILDETSDGNPEEPKGLLHLLFGGTPEKISRGTSVKLSQDTSQGISKHF